MSDDIRPGEDTDIIPALRPQDTPPMPLDLPPVPRGSHRRRRRGMPVPAQIALWGAPVGGAMLVVGLALPGLLGADEPRLAPPAASAPSESAGPVRVPSAPIPSPSMTRQPRTGSAAPTPSKTTPSPTATTTRRSPAPTRTSPSPSPEPSPSRSLTPPVLPSPTLSSTGADDDASPAPATTAGVGE